jgi:hypothetical protein
MSVRYSGAENGGKIMSKAMAPKVEHLGAGALPKSEKRRVL